MCLFQAVQRDTLLAMYFYCEVFVLLQCLSMGNCTISVVIFALHHVEYRHECVKTGQHGQKFYQIMVCELVWLSVLTL